MRFDAKLLITPEHFTGFPIGTVARWHSRVGGRSSMVEPQIVILVVAGSSPVDHPFLFTSRTRFRC